MAVLNEEQEMLRDMARDWATNESPVTEFRKVRAGGEPEAFDREAYRAMAEMGWAGVVIPEEHGGSDFGFMSAGLVIEELGKTLTASPMVMNTVAASAIMLGGGNEQKARWLPKLASGEAIATLAADENAVHDPASIEASVTDGKLPGPMSRPRSRVRHRQASNTARAVARAKAWPRSGRVVRARPFRRTTATFS